MIRRTLAARFVPRVAVTVATVVVAAAASAAVRFPDPLSESLLAGRMLADPVDGKFRQFSLIDAALIAGGVESSQTLDRYGRQFQAWRSAARQICEHHSTALNRAAALFNFMHREILRGGYDAQATELTHIFDAGCFNCESATILLTALAAECDVAVQPVVRPRHAMCVLEIDGRRFDLESTCPQWFSLDDAMRRKAVEAAELRAARDDHPVVRREAGSAALVAVIYYNRGVDMLRENRFAEAVSANVRALRLDSDNEAAAGNLLASINNWSLALAAEGKFADAIALLDRGLVAAPDHEPFHANQRHIYRTWIQALAAAGRADEALSVLAAARAADPGSPLWNYWFVRLTRQSGPAN